jgi:hypothetical protein
MSAMNKLTVDGSDQVLGVVVLQIHLLPAATNVVTNINAIETW